MANYLGRREKGVKKIREKGNENLGDMGPFRVNAIWAISYANEEGMFCLHSTNAVNRCLITSSILYF